MTKKVFISRSLSNRLFKEQLLAKGFTVFGESLIHFSRIPFHELPTCDWLFFYSKKGVRFFLESLIDGKHDLPKTIKCAAMGNGTAKALNAYGIELDFIGNGEPNQTAKDFLVLSKNKTVVFARAKKSKQSIQLRIEQEGVRCIDLIVYDNEIRSDFEFDNSFDYLVFTSPLNVQAFFEKYDLKANQQLIAIGDTTNKALQELGFKDIKVATTPSEEALVDLLMASQ